MAASHLAASGGMDSAKNALDKATDMDPNAGAGSEASGTDLSGSGLSGKDASSGDDGASDGIGPSNAGDSGDETGEKLDTGANGTDVMGKSGVGDAAKGGIKGAATKSAAGATAGAAPVAAQAAALMVFLNWLKMMAMMIMAAAQSLGSLILGAIVAAAKAVVGFFVGIGSAVAGAVGGAISAAAAGVIAFVTTVAVAGTAITGGVVAMRDGEMVARSDGQIQSCTVSVKNAAKAAEGAAVDASAKTEEHAKTVYSVLAAWGMKDENVAGVLGNWSVESGIDPTSVETIYDEKYTFGPRKQDAESKGFKISAVDPDYAARYPAIDLMGIGLGQWTNGRNTLLTNYAKSINKPWYTLETQLGFMISKDDSTRVNQIKALIDGSAGGSVSSATEYFLTKWEGVNNGTLPARTNAAGSWYAKMGGWEKNRSLADSILAQSGSALNNANTDSVANAAKNCQSSTAKVDNSSLASAAISYAWPYNDDGKGNDGTDIYRYLHKQVLGESDNYYSSCDRSVSTAVRWSGTDDAYPAGGVAAQLEYLQSEGGSKWKKVDYNGDKSKLQPGDILLRSDGAVSHTVMYVGEDAIKTIWGEGNYEAGGEIVSGSLNDRSPTVGVFYTGSTGLDTGYVAYRNTTKETSSKYTSVTVPSSMKKGVGDKSVHVTPGPY